MEKSGSSLDLSLAGDNDHDVVFCILAGADGELLHAQLELVASLDGSAVLAIDLDLAEVDSGAGVDRCCADMRVYQLSDREIQPFQGAYGLDGLLFCDRGR